MLDISGLVLLLPWEACFLLGYYMLINSFLFLLVVGQIVIGFVMGFLSFPHRAVCV